MAPLPQYAGESRSIPAEIDVTRNDLILALVAILAWIAPAGADDLIINGDFENGLDSWHPIGPVSISLEELDPESGCCSARIGARTSAWNGIGQWVTDLLVPGRSYAISARIRVANGDDELVTVKLRQIDESGTRWLSLAEGRGRSDAWRSIKGAFTYQPSGAVESLRYYVSGAPAGVDILVDSLRLVELAPFTMDQADQRIEAHRKRNIEFRILDADDCPVAGADLDIRQTSHAFAFGTVINRNHMDNATYKQFIADNFEWGVMENAAKWRQNQWSPGPPDYTDADEIVAFCRENDILLRGHCITWANPIRVPDWVVPLEPKALRTAVEERIDDVVAHFEDDFLHWDVNNEMIANTFFADRLGSAFRAEMFQRARSVDPDVTLMVNDYNVITSNRQSALLHQVEDLEALSAGVDALGAQGHFNEAPAPEVLDRRLDHLAESGLPIWITEYDCTVAEIEARADALERNYRTAFSHPGVSGILMWGFWEGSLNSGPDAALVDLDWTVNAAGLRYQALMDEWTTLAQGTSDSDGRFDCRGFHGSYSLTIQHDGRTTETGFTLEPGDEPLAITISLQSGSSCIDCPEDLDRDGIIDGADLSLLLGGWGTSSARIDLDSNGTIDGADLAILLAAWGSCP
jgi:endo-1,4-beta-xylanase